MSEIIDSLLDRAKEMLKGDNSREISAEEIITILKEYKKLQKELKDSINARFELQRRIDKLLKENKTLKENNLSYQQELAKAWKENEELKRKTYKAYINDKGEIQFIFDNYISKDKIKEALDYIEENSFEDTTGVVLNLKDESYWELWKLLKGDE